MLNLMENVSTTIPVNFPYNFQWIAEYDNGQILTEYNPKYNPKTTDYYSIQKDKLLRFGYVGYGLRVYFNVFNGVFNINKSEYKLFLKINNTTFNITNMLGVKYNDIIQFKRHKAFFNPLNGQLNGNMDKDTIESYNIGWKTKINIGNVSFDTQVRYQLNTKELPVLFIKIIPNTDLQEAEIIIVKDNYKEYNYPCKMKKDVGGYLNWVVR